MRIVIFHGYLLEGTGSNVYNARLADALVGLGHEVHLLCQDRAPETQPFVDAVGTWEGEQLVLERLREPVRCTVYRPPIGRLLPVYVADRYEGFDARPYPDCTDEEIDAYVERNIAAVREVAELSSPDVALANHLIMGPVILARALGGVPYAVTIHGSALEYTVKPHPERFLAPAREGLAKARGVLVGSGHTARSLWALLDDDSVRGRTRLGPPGVDVQQFAPRSRGEAVAALHELAIELQAGGGAPAPEPGGDDAFARDERAAGQALARLDPMRGPIVAFVGKLIVSKGVDLLLACWPLVLARVPGAQLAVVGFGALRDALERLLAALAAGDLEAGMEFARAGRALEGGPAAPLRYLLAFLEGLTGAERRAYLEAATGLEQTVSFTGRLEHSELGVLLPVCDALVFPSTFPEAFGMVAAEAAACGTLPVSAAHSGLAEVSGVLSAAVPEPARPWLSFELSDGAIVELAEKLTAWLLAPSWLRAETELALAATARERYSWEGVARGVIAAGRGELDGLPEISSGTG